MQRVERILNDPLFQNHLKKIAELEETRIFCKHNLAHFLDVARIAYALSLEQNIPIKKDLIYGAALLHDIGRHLQYQFGVDHALASVDLAVPILENAGYIKTEIEEILSAIRKHRKGIELIQPLEQLIFHADKASRLCLLCPARSKCNKWENQSPLFLNY